MAVSLCLALTLIASCLWPAAAAPTVREDAPTTPQNRYETLNVVLSADATLSLSERLPNVTWLVAPAWNESLSVPVWRGGNLLLNYSAVESVDEQKLRLRELLYIDEGFWFAEASNGTTVKTWHVKVHMPPVLVAVSAQPTPDPSITLTCETLEKEERFEAYLEFLKPDRAFVKEHRSFLNKTKVATVWVSRFELCPGSILARCCYSSFQHVCSKWTPITLGAFVSHHDLPRRSNCPSKPLGSPFPTTIRATRHDGFCDPTQLCEGSECYQLDDGKILGCPGTNLTVLFPMNNSSIHRYMFEGGPDVSLTNSSHYQMGRWFFNITDASPSDSGPYAYIHWVDMFKQNLIHQFTVSVEPFLRASIALVEWTQQRFTLRCAHSLHDLNQDIRVDWEMSYIGHTYEKSGSLISFYPDCWQKTHYKYHLAVRCHVTTQIWYTRSQWFLAEMEKHTSAYTVKTCNYLPKKPLASSTLKSLNNKIEL